MYGLNCGLNEFTLFKDVWSNVLLFQNDINQAVNTKKITSFSKVSLIFNQESEGEHIHSTSRSNRIRSKLTPMKISFPHIKRI